MRRTPLLAAAIVVLLGTTPSKAELYATLVGRTVVCDDGRVSMSFTVQRDYVSFASDLGDEARSAKTAPEEHGFIATFRPPGLEPYAYSFREAAPGKVIVRLLPGGAIERCAVK